MASKTLKKAEIHPLDALAASPEKVMALMLWKARHREPDLYVKIDENDLKGFDDCVAYLKVEPLVLIKRPAGLPAQAGIPATHNRRAVPGREAIPPKPFVIAALVDKQTKDAIRPIENNEGDFDTAAQAAAVRKARDQAQDLAQRLLQQARSGEYSLSDMTDSANALITMARALA